MAAAGATRRLRLGTGICLVIERDPIVMAKEVATLDRLSNADRASNSVFTRNLIRRLAEPDLTLVQIAKRLQIEVKQLAASV